ncbi:MAG: hypothetical protein R3E01_10990 [Pirellulaceae bacterium]
MRPQPGRWLLGLAFVLAISATASAQHRWQIDFWRNNVWPNPFVLQDRITVCAPFTAMTTAGWMRQNTISHLHFNPETQQLTETGRLKVRSILTQGPEDSRDIYIVKGQDAEQTEIRMTSVRDAAVHFLPAGGVPNVTAIDREYRAWNADEVDAIARKQKQSIPAPRLSGPAGSAVSSQ